MTIAHARVFEGAIRRAYKLGRVDQSIEAAAEQLREMVRADPGITPSAILRLCGAPATSRCPWDYEWDHALWTLADTWCDLQRELLGRAAQPRPVAPHSALQHDLSARGLSMVGDLR